MYQFSKKILFSLAAGNHGRAVKIPLQGGVDYRLNEIARRNETSIQNGGMLGALEMFASYNDPRTLKADAAKSLLTNRANRLALKMQGRNPSCSTGWLERAARMRKAIK